MPPLLLVLLAAGAAAFVLAPLVIRIAAAFKLYDTPGGDTRHVHKRPVPRLGGVPVFVATVIGVSVIALQNPLSTAQQRFFLAILLGGGSVFIAGLLDDVRGLRPLTKLVVECVAALIVCRLGLEIEMIGLGPAGTVLTGHLAVPLTVLWIVGVTNAFNLVDGLDGLATGIAIVALSTVLATAYMLRNGAVVIGCVALLGALLGFGRYNLPPARLFLGDSGSLFVGFFLAVLSVEASIKSTTVVLFVVPLCALAIPLIDMTLAIARRWLRGAPIFGADARHMHHRLLALGLRPERAVLVLVLAAVAFALLGMVVVFTPQIDQVRIGLFGGTIALALAIVGIWRLKYDEFGEAASTFADAFQARQVVHERICARDAARRISDAESLAQVNAILRDSAAELRYVRMELVRADGRRNDFIGRAAIGRPTHGEARPTWVLECQVGSSPGARTGYVLSISGETRLARRGYGAERIVQVLAPTLEAWVARSSTTGLDAEVPLVAVNDDLGNDGSLRELGDRRLPRDERTNDVNLAGLRLSDTSPTAERPTTRL